MNKMLLKVWSIQLQRISFSLEDGSVFYARELNPSVTILFIKMDTIFLLKKRLS